MRPFVVMGICDENGYFYEGITEQVINVWVVIEELRVGYYFSFLFEEKE